MTMALPAFTVGMCRPTSGIGRLIAARQGSPYSHAVVSVGAAYQVWDDYRTARQRPKAPAVWEATSPKARLTPEDYWTARPPEQAVDWWGYAPGLTRDQERALRSWAYATDGRVFYAYWELALFLLRGLPGYRGSGMFCTQGVAEAALVVLDLDLSGCMQPWNVDLRELHSALVLDPRWQRIEP